MTDTINITDIELEEIIRQAYFTGIKTSESGAPTGSGKFRKKEVKEIIGKIKWQIDNRPLCEFNYDTRQTWTK